MSWLVASYHPGFALNPTSWTTTIERKGELLQRGNDRIPDWDFAPLLALWRAVDLVSPHRYDDSGGEIEAALGTSPASLWSRCASITGTALPRTAKNTLVAGSRPRNRTLPAENGAASRPSSSAFASTSRSTGLASTGLDHARRLPSSSRRRISMRWPNGSFRFGLGFRRSTPTCSSSCCPSLPRTRGGCDGEVCSCSTTVATPCLIAAPPRSRQHLLG